MQYAFARVKDPNVTYVPLLYFPLHALKSLCTALFRSSSRSTGVAMACPRRKGLFHTHSSAVARFLRGTHIIISTHEVRIFRSYVPLSP